MSVTIAFRGNLFFHWEGEELRRVLLPDCLTAKKLPSGKNGRIHFAGIVVQRGGKGPEEWTLLNGKQSVAIGTGRTRVKFPKSISDRLPPGADAGKLKASPPTASIIDVRVPGDWSTVEDPSGRFRFGKSDEPLILAIEFTTATAVKITGSGVDLDLLDKDWACVYSYEIEKPTREQLYAVREVDDAEDDDFEWIYELYESVKKPRDIPKLKKGPSGPDSLSTMKTPNVSTCFPGGGNAG